ncbi:pseudouridine synthase [Corynebacterium sp.]|uniref:pseudouridine synthase n=1 Tax=Corynebacterium sp. TaxID=1720 RepID=UPI0026DEC8ED|nr:pseudouridine synthase [Corynebacterium sp.]MDO5513103.1 pseudouridine synthase [Corynebacterium sp.]
MPDAPIPARQGISPRRVVLRGVVPGDREYWAGAAGDAPFAWGTLLEAGAELERPQPAWFHPEIGEEPTIPFDYTVLHCDEDLIVVDKPCFVPSTSNGRIVRETVQTRLRIDFGEDDIVPLHRLDRLTSGVLVCSRRAATRGDYQRLFQKRQVRKLYRARVVGEVTVGLDWELVELPLRKERGIRQVRVVDGGTATRTWIRRVGEQEVEVRPVTGHTHQIRVVLNHLGMPIDNDDTYPVDRGLSLYDFSSPLRLRAMAVDFDDPHSRRRRAFRVAGPGWD